MKKRVTATVSEPCEYPGDLEHDHRACEDDRDYDDFLAHVDGTFLEACGRDGSVPLFTTDVAGLWDVYLDGFAAGTERQHYTCRACRHFITRYGGLVTIDGSDGRTVPVAWSEAGTPDRFRPIVTAMAKAVRRAKVTGVFLASHPSWGTPRTGPWRHLAVRPPTGMLVTSQTHTAGQLMAERREDFRNVTRALSEITVPHLETALTLLRSDSLYRSEKVLGQAEWLRALHAARAAARGARKANMVWCAVATAPAGYCHPRTSMIGTLLDDIAAGKGYAEVSRAFKAKMDPLAYQRPQSAPAAGTIRQAEKLVQQLDVAGSLARRFARVDEVQALWRPAPPAATSPRGGVFDHLKPKGVADTPPMLIPAQVMTWAKFSRTVLPGAERIELQAPACGDYTALLTAVDPDAPPILQWDLENARNPVSWYVWHGGSHAAQWGLVAGRYYDVSAVTLKPSMWGPVEFAHHGKGVIFLIADARESVSGGTALFPETLKEEFRSIRSVIEAHSRSASIEGLGAPHAAGVLLADSRAANWDATVRVWSAGRSVECRLDRWE